MKEALGGGVLLPGQVNHRRDRREMETADSLLPGNGYEAVRRAAQTDPGHDQEDANPAPQRSGARRGYSSKGLRCCATQGGILSHQTRGEPETDLEVDVCLGNEAPQTVWHS